MVVKLCTSELVDDDVVRVDESKEVKISEDLSPVPLLRGGTLTYEFFQQNPLLLSSIPVETLKVVKGFLFPAHRVFQFNLGLTSAVSTDSSGNWGGAAAGTSFAVTGVTGSSEWTGLAGLFDEVFIEKMRLRWMPHNKYTQYNLQASAASGHRYSVGIALTNLHHGGSTYSTFGAMLTAPTTTLGYTGDYFSHTWKNIERMDPMGPSSSVKGTAYIGQNWCQTDSTTFAGYGGSVQSIGCKAMDGYTSTVELGQFAVQFRLHYRNRA